MKTTTSIASLGAALALLACSTGALAQDSNTARLGMYAVFYHTAADQVQGPFVPPGVSADVGNVQTVYLAYLRRLSSHFDLELAAGVPPRTDTIGKGPAALGSAPWNGVTVGTVKWLSPSVLLNYSFFDESTRFRPFVGLGINFTHFYDREINAAGQAALGGPTYVTLTNSIGPAASVGAVYHVMKHWTVHASFNAAEIASHLEANTAGIVRKSYVAFNPQALVFSVGYSF
ncbi:MAG TPA: OmpW family outer membrane protein [Burkholderiaceae bacterium]|jgi:outer membrane protein|nr:OmpW family outer membrane protein [Burkholderiaceae bacterium]